MARKSKFGNIEASSECKMWKAAIYLRLSREDGDKEESDSINNQKNQIVDFVAGEADIDIYDCYIDDGLSGTNFERPSFMRMMEDINSRKVNCVIVKDLSRFGRNYVDAGHYLEKVFPFMGIRFISLNDYLDSYKNPQSMNNLVVPFKNLINDEYCRDISNKIRSSLDIKRKQGKHIGSFAAYGYLKDEADNNKLIIDEEAAEIVRYIYELYLAGTGCLGIAKILNSQGVANPAEHKKRMGLKYRPSAKGNNDALWSDATIRRILKNRMYTGCMVQGVHKTISYKVQTPVKQQEENWFIVENTHEAIIEKEVFEKIQAMFNRDCRTAPKEQKVYLFSGFLRCADCGRAMNRKIISQPYGEYSYYVCSTYKKMNKGACTKHTIRSDKLEQAVFITIRQQIELAVSMDEMINFINNHKQVNRISSRLETQISNLEAEKKKIENIKISLYPDWKNGDITKEEYQQLKERYDSDFNAVCAKIEKLQEELNTSENGDGSNNFIQTFVKYKAITALTREMLTELVEYIYVHEGEGITIEFKYNDEYLRVAEFIENNKNLANITA